MPTIAELDEIARNPEPAYPEYEQVRAEALAMGGLIDPREIPEMEEVARRHGTDWCTAVLGKPYNGLRRVGMAEARMLVIADRMGLTPPLPERIARWYQQDQELRDRLAAEKQAVRDQETAAWNLARHECAVQSALTVWVSRASQRNPNRHAVPDRDLHSKRGLHRAGRALCESATRSKPLQLSGPVDEPATCVRCLAWMREVTDQLPPRRHKWARGNAQHTRVCTICGTTRLAEPDPHGPGWITTWTTPDGTVHSGHTPPCPGPQTHGGQR